MNALGTNLFTRAEQARIAAHPEDYEKGLDAFRTALRSYARGEAALSVALERAGLPAQPQRMNSALTYAGRQLEGASKSSLKTDGIANNGIEMGMTDLERYGVLRGQSISLVDASNLISNDDLERYRHTSKNDIEKELRQMLTESNVLGDKQKGAALKNNYLNMQAFFSSRGLHESIERQSKGVSNLAALMPVFRETYQNAVPVLVQGNRYLYTSLNESDTESFAYLLGAFTYKDEIIPVQFELKKNANPEDNSVYVVATIEKDALITGKRDNSHLPTTASSNINIADLISYVKQNNERILANLPAQFLTEEQKAGKREDMNLLYDITKTSDITRHDGFFDEASIHPLQGDVTNTSISTDSGNVNTKFSLRSDEDGLGILCKFPE